MIKAGCPEFICTKCGKAREKVYKTDRRPTRPGEKTKVKQPGRNSRVYQDRDPNHLDTRKIRDDYRQPEEIGNRDPQRHVTEKFEIGYTACKCNAEFEPGIVWDPFVGSGTTLQVAARLGRNYGGSELKPEYIEMAEKRVMQGETGIPIKEQRKGQKGLF
jgi:DNA modification methylase